MFLISLSLSSIHRLLPSTTGVKGYHRYYQTTFPPFDKKSLLRNQFSDSGAFESLMAFDIFFFLFSFSFLSFFFSLLSAERIFFFAARRVYSRCNATWIRLVKVFRVFRSGTKPFTQARNLLPRFLFRRCATTSAFPEPASSSSGIRGDYSFLSDDRPAF